MLIYGTLLTSYVIYFSLNSASSVAFEANKSRKVLIKLYMNNDKVLGYDTKIKVYDFLR